MLGWRLSGVSLSWPWCAIMPGVPLTTDELLTTTRSVRKRLDLTRPVPLGLVQECLEIALQAPNGGMREGWHWIVVTDPQVRARSEEHTSELQSQSNLVCRLLLEKKKNT